MIKLIGEAEIGDDDVSVLVQQQIFQLEIAMDNVFLVKVRNSRDKLGEKLLSVSFLQISAGENMIKQLSTCLSASPDC